MSRSGQSDTIRITWERRQPERRLLLSSFACLALGFLMVLGVEHDTVVDIRLADWLALFIYAASLVAIHVVLVLSRFRGDQVLPGALAFLSGFGLLARFRMGSLSSDDPASMSHYAFPAGVAAMLLLVTACQRGRYRALAPWAWGWGLLSLALLAGVLLTGQRFRGGVYAAGLITPGEILKVTVILFLAGYIDRLFKELARWGGGFLFPPLRPLLPLAVFWVLLATLLLLQRDLGMFVILSVALLSMLSIATGQLGYIVYGALGAWGLGYLALHYFLHAQRRVEVWQDPFQDSTGAGWQVLQGLSGMYSGGLWGTGLGRGSPGYTPIADADFMYAVIGEELGFIGCVLLLVFFLVLFNRGLRIAYQSRSSYGLLVCAGLTSVIATQTFLHIGGVTKFVPLTGITLPFISHGGSSLLTGFISLGLILAVSDGEAIRSKRTVEKTAKRRLKKPLRKNRPAGGASGNSTKK